MKNIFYIKGLKSLISHKFLPSEALLWRHFESRIQKNGTFFAFEAAISVWEVPRQHHLSQQFFGGLVTWKQHLLFLLPKIVDFTKTWKKSAPQMKIELWGGGEAQICCRFVATEYPTNMLPICNIT